jgi:putative Mg2+ transporter-C (MgtC) family protein
VSLPGYLLASGSPNVEGPLQFAELGLALLLSAVIGVEREIRQKSARLRTHTLVGVGAALFMLISKYGFNDVLQPNQVVLDPSRVAAQIVTGIGFLGAGLIFVRRDSVRGLTTAAAIWVTAGVGAAAGSGLPLIAVLGTGAYLVVALAFPLVTKLLPSSGSAVSTITVSYPDGQRVLRDVLQTAADRGFAVEQLSAGRANGRPGAGHGRDGSSAGSGNVEVMLNVHGRGSVNELATALTELPGVRAVVAKDINVPTGD